MKLLSIATSLLLANSLVFGAEDTAKKMTNFAKQVGGIEAPTCVTCTSETTSISTVQKINKKTRALTLKNEHGKISTITAPQEVRNFDQIKVGDIVTVCLKTNTDVVVTRGALETCRRTVNESMTRAKLGEKPARKYTKTTTNQAKVTDLEFKTKAVTLESMHGTVKIIAQNPEHFNTLRVGDIVDAISGQSIEINVTAPVKLP